MVSVYFSFGERWEKQMMSVYFSCGERWEWASTETMGCLELHRKFCKTPKAVATPADVCSGIRVGQPKFS